MNTDCVPLVSPATMSPVLAFCHSHQLLASFLSITLALSMHPWFAIGVEGEDVCNVGWVGNNRNGFRDTSAGS